MVERKQSWYVQSVDLIENHEMLQRPEFAIFKKRASHIKQQIKEQEFRITVVGEFSAGKSTFLNALIGKDVLPHALRETTASVTYIRNVDRNHPFVNKMVIDFSSKNKEQVVLDIESNPAALKQYVTTMSNDFNVVEEIRSVTIYLDFPTTDEPIVFVDTPGLNGMAEGHYDLTLSEIQRAHASIFLFNIRGLSQTNTRLLKLLHQYQQKFIFVLNFIDELKKEEGETSEKKLNELKEDLREAGVIGEIQAFGVSALKALVSKDTTIKRLYDYETVDMDDARRSLLMEESYFFSLEKYLWEEVIAREKDKILKGSIERSIHQLASELVDELQELSKLNAAKINHEDLLEVEERIKRLEERSLKNWQTTEAYIGSRENDLHRMFKDKLQQDISSIQEGFERSIRKLTYNQLDEFKRNVENDVYQRQLSQSFSHLSKSYEDALKELLDEVFHGAILRISKFHPTVVVQSDHKVNFVFDMEEADFENLDIVHKLKAVKKRELQYNDEFKEMIHAQSMVNKELTRVTKESESFKRTEKEKAEEKARKVRSLGSIPDVYRYEETRTREVERATFSLFRLFGSTTKTEKYTVMVTDDSEQKKWKNKKAQIEQEYTKQMNELRQKQEDYEERKRRLSRNSQENTRKLEQVNRKLDEYAQEVKHLEKLRNEIYEKNKREYFDIQKRDLIALVRNHIEEVISHELEEILVKNIEVNSNSIKKSAKKYYTDSENKYRQKLKLLLSQTTNDFDKRLDMEIQKSIKDFSKVTQGIKEKETIQR